ncbi:hypothetical protein Hanom_Chr12g01121751 [Helianthus anomalus]
MLPTKRTTTKERPGDIKGVTRTTNTAHSFLQGILTILIIYIIYVTLLWVTQYLICLGKLLVKTKIQRPN